MIHHRIDRYGNRISKIYLWQRSGVPAFFGYPVVNSILCHRQEDDRDLCGNNKTMRFYMRKIKGLRWYMIALVTLGTVLGLPDA
ncbi:Hexuronate transporter [Citrobacter amalonaticus]|nr:Hexuronate transporter [Citrobacter amalonaticus]